MKTAVSTPEPLHARSSRHPRRTPLLLLLILGLAVASPGWSQARASGEAALNDALSAFFSQEFQRALPLLRPLAAGGDVSAQYCLGFILLKGAIGVPPSPAEGIRWLEAAADQNSVTAQAELGEFFIKGSPDIPADQKRAEAYLRQAALAEKEEETYPRSGAIRASAYRLGELYRLGTLRPADMSAARQFYGLAGAHLDAVEEERLCGSVMAVAEHLPDLAERANRGDPEAARLLGVFHYCQDHFPEAVFWLEKAAEGNDPEALGLLGELLLEGKGCAKQIQAGLESLEKSGRAGNLRALQILTRLCWFGERGPKDPEKALFWSLLTRDRAALTGRKPNTENILNRLQKQLAPDVQRRIEAEASAALEKMAVR